MISGKSVLAITLARGGSKGIPRKNVAMICGIPLIAYTILEAKKSKYIDRYIVSTDDSEISEVASHYGADVPFLRPKELSSDNATSAAALIHAVKWLEDRGENFDIVVELMATNPLKTVEHIDESLELLVQTGAPFCVGVQRVFDHHPSRLKYIRNGLLMDFYPEVIESRRQDLQPEAFVRAGSIYCMATEELKRTGARYGKDNTAAYIMPPLSVVNIDEPVDLLVAKQILENRR